MLKAFGLFILIMVVIGVFCGGGLGLVGGVIGGIAGIVGGIIAGIFGIVAGILGAIAGIFGALFGLLLPVLIVVALVVGGLKLLTGF